MKWERKLAQSVVTIVLQALVARFVYHLFEKSSQKKQRKIMTDALRMVLSVKRPFVFLLILLLTMPSINSVGL